MNHGWTSKNGDHLSVSASAPDRSPATAESMVQRTSLDFQYTSVILLRSAAHGRPASCIPDAYIRWRDTVLCERRAQQ